MKKVVIKKSEISGLGIYASSPIKKGELIGYIKGEIKHKINKTKKDSQMYPDWVGFKKDFWVDPLPPFKYINHSCDANCGIKGTKSVFALKNIRAGEELTFDYSTSEVDLNWELKETCNCKSRNCRKRITSIQTLRRNDIIKYMPYIPTAYKEKLGLN